MPGDTGVVLCAKCPHKPHVWIPVKCCLVFTKYSEVYYLIWVKLIDMLNVGKITSAFNTSPNTKKVHCTWPFATHGCFLCHCASSTDHNYSHFRPFKYDKTGWMHRDRSPRDPKGDKEVSKKVLRRILKKQQEQECQTRSLFNELRYLLLKLKRENSMLGTSLFVFS